MAARALVWSSGGGTQSIAIAILIAQGKLPRPECIVMADTGRERSATWDYHYEHVGPMLQSIGLEVEIAGHELSTVDLHGHNGDLLLPAFTADADGDGAADGKLPTLCSTEWKQRVIRRYLRAKGYGPKKPVDLWLGISLDESHRMKAADVQWVRHRWPLCFDLRLSRADCRRIVREYGWPEPPRSACWMCPHARNEEWRDMRDHHPEDWQAAIALDRQIQASHAVFLHHSGHPLEDAAIDVDEATTNQAGCATQLCML